MALLFLSIMIVYVYLYNEMVRDVGRTQSLLIISCKCVFTSRLLGVSAEHSYDCVFTARWLGMLIYNVKLLIYL